MNTSSLPKPNHLQNNDNILSKITYQLKGVIRRRNGGILAFCPSHNDKKGRSLAVTTGHDGQVLVHCFAGCSVHEITQAMGLEITDLFPHANGKCDPKSRLFFNEWQILSALQFDALVVLIAAHRLSQGEKLPEADIEYLSKIVTRINEAASYARRANHG